MKNKPGQRLPQAMRMKIRELSAGGKSIMDICRETGVAWETAAHWVNAPEHAVTLPAEEILMLLRERVGQRAIARRVGVSLEKVVEFAHANGFVGPGPRWHPSTKQLVTLIDLTFGGNDSVSSIARKIRGPYGPISRLIHKVRKCPAFLTTKVLGSFLPMAHRETKLGASAYQRQREDEALLSILDLVARACFDGKLPKDPTQLFSVAIATCLMFFQRERPNVHIGYTGQAKVCDLFLPRFANALETMRMVESGLVN
jgi:transposase-like protein